MQKNKCFGKYKHLSVSACTPKHLKLKQIEAFKYQSHYHFTNTLE